MTLLQDPPTAEIVSPPPHAATPHAALTSTSSSSSAPSQEQAKVRPEDLLAMPDNGSLELVDGKIVEKQVSKESSQTELMIGSRLLNFALQSGLAEVFPASLGYRVFPDAAAKIRKPDASVIHKSRLEAIDDPNPGFMSIVPDLAVEVISTHDTVGDVDQKLDDYESAGFPLIWIVDPARRSVTVYPLKAKPYILLLDDEITAGEALPGFKCRVADLFPPRAARVPGEPAAAGA